MYGQKWVDDDDDDDDEEKRKGERGSVGVRKEREGEAGGQERENQGM